MEVGIITIVLEACFFLKLNISFICEKVGFYLECALYKLFIRYLCLNCLVHIIMCLYIHRVHQSSEWSYRLRDAFLIRSSCQPGTQEI